MDIQSQLQVIAFKFLKWTIVQNMSTKNSNKGNSCCSFLHCRTKQVSRHHSISFSCVGVFFFLIQVWLWRLDGFWFYSCFSALIKHTVLHVDKISKHNDLSLDATFIKFYQKAHSNKENTLILNAITNQISCWFTNVKSPSLYILCRMILNKDLYSD